jgi:hypothetical protein
VIDVGKIGKKAEALRMLRDQALKEGGPTSPIIFIDGIRKPSASKL